MEAYAAYYDNEIRLKSSSGGIFSILARGFDVVYGVAMTEDCYGAVYLRTTNSIEPLRGSKYLQAKVGDAFLMAKKDLESNRTVLFSGTGCQINGLKMYLGKEYDNLLCVDVICHGVPSPKLWREYVLFQEKKHGKLMSINFRSKDHSWRDFGIKENLLYISKDKDYYMQMFLRNICLRPSCYNCHAKTMKMADITIGDFWGIEDVLPSFNCAEGVSLVITRTEKGQKSFQNICSQLCFKEVKYDDAVRKNKSEYQSVVKPKQRDMFYYDLDKLPFIVFANKYLIKPIIKRRINEVKDKLMGGA